MMGSVQMLCLSLTQKTCCFFPPWILYFSQPPPSCRPFLLCFLLEGNSLWILIQSTVSYRLHFFLTIKYCQISSQKLLWTDRTLSPCNYRNETPRTQPSLLTDGCDTHTPVHTSILQDRGTDTQCECVYHGDTHKHSFYRSTKLHKAPNASSLWGWTKDREAGLWAGPVCRGGGTEDGCKQHRPAYTPQARLLRHMAWWRQGLGIPVRRGEGCRGSEAQATWNLDRCSRQAYKLLTVLDRMSSKLLNMHQQTRA